VFKRRAMRHIAVNCASELHLVVGVDPRVVLGARYSDVRQPLIYELLARPLCLDMNEDAAGGLPLGAMARHGVPVIQVAPFARFERGGSAGVPLNLHSTVAVDTRLSRAPGSEPSASRAKLASHTELSFQFPTRR
jgi:hypothetical protein